MDYASHLQQLGCTPPAQEPDRDVESIEAAIGVLLPPEYRKFLLSCGGWSGDVLCPCQEPTPFGEDHVTSAFHDAGEVRGLLGSLITPRNMITIAVGPFGGYTCLSIAGIDHGWVYALDGEFRADWSDEEFEQRFHDMDLSVRRYLELRAEAKLARKLAGYSNVYILAKD